MFNISSSYKDSIKAVSETKLQLYPPNAPNFDVVVDGSSTGDVILATATVTSKKDTSKVMKYSLYTGSTVRFAEFMASLTDVQCNDMVKKK